VDFPPSICVAAPGWFLEKDGWFQPIPYWVLANSKQGIRPGDPNGFMGIASKEWTHCIHFDVMSPEQRSRIIVSGAK
jgi:hypothetical protein